MNTKYKYKFYENDLLIAEVEADTLTVAMHSGKLTCRYNVAHQYPFFAVLQRIGAPECFLGVTWKKSQAKGQ